MVISYGGGVQSTALVVLAAQGELGETTTAVFANVGDDSEHPDTLTYVRDVVRPWASAHGINVVEIARAGRTLLRDLLRHDSASVQIPVRMASRGAPGRRRCTADFKIRVIERWLAQHGATKTAPVDLAIGFSIDEIARVSNRTRSDYSTPVYPLLDRGLTRERCRTLVIAAGLPGPPRSACWFCPYHRIGEWQQLRRQRPDLFRRAAKLERYLSARRARLGKDAVYFSSRARPLLDAIPPSRQPSLFEPDDATCDDGYCWT